MVVSYFFPKTEFFPQYCLFEKEGVPHSITDSYLVGGPDPFWEPDHGGSPIQLGVFEIFYTAIDNQGCSMPEEAPHVCDKCCNCDDFRPNGIAALAQDDDSDDDSDDDWLVVEPNENVDELRSQIQRQNFELFYDEENNWIIYKYPLCRMCWERKRELQQA